MESTIAIGSICYNISVYIVLRLKGEGKENLFHSVVSPPVPLEIYEDHHLTHQASSFITYPLRGRCYQFFNGCGEVLRAESPSSDHVLL